MKRRKTPETVSSYLGKQVVLEGKFAFKGIAQINGCIKGSIESEEGILVIGKEGEVHAEIDAGTVVVNGLVKGTIRAARKIEILSMGNVTGDIYAPEIFIDPGANFNGECHMG